jgi:hypothetical protein
LKVNAPNLFVGHVTRNERGRGQLKESLPAISRNHFRSSARNRVVSIESVDAVTIPRVSPAVVIPHSTIQHTSAVLPMPWPDATAI